MGVAVAVAGDGALLVIDEIQKVANWPETIKGALVYPTGAAEGVVAGFERLADSGRGDGKSGRAV